MVSMPGLTVGPALLGVNRHLIQKRYALSILFVLAGTLDCLFGRAVESSVVDVGYFKLGCFTRLATPALRHPTWLLCGFHCSRIHNQGLPERPQESTLVALFRWGVIHEVRMGLLVYVYLDHQLRLLVSPFVFTHVIFCSENCAVMVCRYFGGSRDSARCLLGGRALIVQLDVLEMVLR
ncbi:hypothetical protein EDD85DRAFT_861542 [Armillaria nabsnona]|nr:hypothetical protein EDD85DRAFT_861542 [Armillaria nabsnona]